MNETQNENGPRVDDIHITRVHPLISPATLAEDLPASDTHRQVVASGRRAIEDILDEKSQKFMVIVGPCSIHDVDAAVEYATRLKEETAGLDNLLVIMRVYFEKPRTVVGWKGLINDPDLDGTFQINRGLHLARKVLLDITEIGLPAATEFLDTTFGQYYADLISWGAIGARTVESQIHRELASGLSMPVGIKNRTDGDLKVAIDAIRAAAHKHVFPSLTKDGVPAIFETEGNKYCHLILRGGDVSGPNYDDLSIDQAVSQLQHYHLPANIIVDCSHGNSHKQAANQPRVVHSLMATLAKGNPHVRGIMLESHLKSGRQDYHADTAEYGKSITDACLSLKETLPLLRELNDALGE